MRKIKFLQILAIFIIITIITFLIATLFLNRLESSVEHYVATSNILILFLVIFLIEFMPQPIGPELFFVSTSLLGFNYFIALILTIIAATIATYTHYRIGEYFYEKVCSNGKCDRHVAKFNKYGKYALFISAIGPIPYVPMCWISGSINMKRKTFWLYGPISRYLRIIVTSIFIYYII